MNERAKIAAMIGLPVACVGAVAWIATAATGDDSDQKAPSETSQETVLEVARDRCIDQLIAADWQLYSDSHPGLVMRLADEGRSVLIDTPTFPEGAEAAADSADCLVRESGGPESLITKMGQTSAIMGRQSDAYGDVEVSWIYAGSNKGGFSAIFEIAD